MAAEFAYDMYSAAPERAPQKRPQKKTQREFESLERKSPDLDAKSKSNAVTIIKCTAFAAFVVVCLGIMCSSLAGAREAKLKYSRELANLEIYKSQLVEVNAKLGTLVTPDKIAKIAVEQLGMVKLPDENKTYAVSNRDNEIVFSREK